MMKRILIFGACMLLLAGCAKQLDEIRPKHAISSEAVNESDLSKLINGVLNKMESLAVGFWYDGDYHGENFGIGPGGKEIEAHDALMSPSNGTSLSRWQSGFNTLMHVNELLKSANSADPDNVVTRQAKGTAYFCRAYIYYQLVIRFGGVPILKTPSMDVIPRATEDKVWELIVSDLLEAEKYLEPVSNVYRPSDEACWALLSRVYLWTGDKSNAVTYADKVLANKSLVSGKTSEDFASMFVAGNSSKEVVFALANKRTSSFLRIFEQYNDNDGSWSYAVHPDLVATLYADGFGAGDIRKAPTQSNDRIIKFPNGVQDGVQFISNTDPSASPIVLFRLADVYLAKAEAQGTSEGLATMKTFMESRYASVSLPSSMTAQEFQNLVLDENNREFYGEGRRWFDIKRTKRMDLYKEFPENGDYLLYWPVPQDEINLVGKDAYPQNPGY